MRALSRPLVKLIDVVSSGVGLVSRPILNIINADADGRAQLIRAKYRHAERVLELQHSADLEQHERRLALPVEATAATDAIALPIEYHVEISDADFTALEVASVRASDARQGVKRRANLMAVVGEAADQIGADASEDPVDPDWTARFFEYAQDVTPEDLQRLWGAALAREVERPGTVPARALDLLRNLSRTELGVLERLAARVSTERVYLPYGKHKLSLREVDVCEDAGLLSGELTLNWRATAGGDGLWNTPSHARLTYAFGYAIELETADRLRLVAARRVTRSAIPLINLCRSRPDEAYLRSVAADLGSAEHKLKSVRLVEPRE